MSDYGYHEACKILPDMTAEEYGDLRTDIAANGQLEPIVLHYRLILDGRHRYRACLSLGVEPWMIDRSEIEDPVRYVISKNLHRRHLTASQRAQVAAELVLINKHSERQAAELVNVSDTLVHQAKKVAKAEEAGDAPQGTTDAIKEGSLKVGTAHSKYVKAPTPQPAPLIEDDVMAQFHRETALGAPPRNTTLEQLRNNILNANAIIAGNRHFRVEPQDRLENGIELDITDLLQIKEQTDDNRIL